jgi:hypothetical protein
MRLAAAQPQTLVLYIQMVTRACYMGMVQDNTIYSEWVADWCHTVVTNSGIRNLEGNNAK